MMKKKEKKKHSKKIDPKDDWRLRNKKRRG